MNCLPLRAAGLALALALALALPAHAQTYEIDPVLTDAGFIVTYLGVAQARGRFDRVVGRIVLDPERRAGSIDLAFDSASISTGWSVRDAFLRSENMFDVRRYPWLRFRSRHLDYGADGLAGVDGDVTLRGVTRPVRLTVQHLWCAIDPRDGREGCGAQIRARISRAEFGMTYAYPLVGDDVDLDVVVRAHRD
jgi:polyisoprenoid-binding protein YceI